MTGAVGMITSPVQAGADRRYGPGGCRDHCARAAARPLLAAARRAGARTGDVVARPIPSGGAARRGGASACHRARRSRSAGGTTRIPEGLMGAARGLQRVRRAVLGEPLLAHLAKVAGVHPSRHSHFANDQCRGQRHKNADEDQHMFRSGALASLHANDCTGVRGACLFCYAHTRQSTLRLCVLY